MKEGGDKVAEFYCFGDQELLLSSEGHFCSSVTSEFDVRTKAGIVGMKEFCDPNSSS